MGATPGSRAGDPPQRCELRVTRCELLGLASVAVMRWAFADEHGQPWPYATMHRHCRAILRAAELPHPTPHDTRHTFAVNLLYWTNDIDYVAQMLGDTLTVVVATYLKHQGARDKYERYAGIGDQKQGARSSRALRPG